MREEIFSLADVLREMGNSASSRPGCGRERDEVRVEMHTLSKATAAVVYNHLGQSVGAPGGVETPMDRVKLKPRRSGILAILCARRTDYATST